MANNNSNRYWGAGSSSNQSNVPGSGGYSGLPQQGQNNQASFSLFSTQPDEYLQVYQADPTLYQAPNPASYQAPNPPFQTPYPVHQAPNPASYQAPNPPYQTPYPVHQATAYYPAPYQPYQHPAYQVQPHHAAAYYQAPYQAYEAPYQSFQVPVGQARSPTPPPSLSPTPPPSPETLRVLRGPQYKCKKCKYFEQGYCRDGEECFYAHGGAELRTVAQNLGI